MGVKDRLAGQLQAMQPNTPVPTRSGGYPAHLALYAEASARCLRGEVEDAQLALAQAYAAVPPRKLTVDDHRLLSALADELTYVGQFLPSLQPTLDLLTQLHHMCGGEAAQPLVGWRGDHESSSRP